MSPFLFIYLFSSSLVAPAQLRHGAGDFFLYWCHWFWQGSSYPPELIHNSLGRFLLESGMMGGLQGSMGVVLCHSAVTEKIPAYVGIRTNVVHDAVNAGPAR